MKRLKTEQTVTPLRPHTQDTRLAHPVVMHLALGEGWLMFSPRLKQCVLLRPSSGMDSDRYN